MKLITMVFYLASACFLISCNENNCNSIKRFSGITERDDHGNLLNQDKDDWTLNDHWNDHELALFDKTYKTNCSAPSHFAISAYPNPTTGQFQIRFNKSAATRVDLRLIDSNCNIITSRNDIEGYSLGLQAGSSKTKEVVRLYYKFIEDGCEYEGHGDIMVRL